MAEPTALDRYHQLVAKVDSFVANVTATYGSAMQCARGCFDCCLTRPTVTGVEAAVITAHVDALTPQARAELRTHLERNGDDASRCAALDASGSCLIYAARPLVCRSHGVPIRMGGSDGAEPSRGSLPVIDSCHLNFRTGPTLEEVEPAFVLDQATLSTVLAALDLALAHETDAVVGRHDLATLLRELTN